MEKLLVAKKVIAKNLTCKVMDSYLRAGIRHHHSCSWSSSQMDVLYVARTGREAEGSCQAAPKLRQSGLNAQAQRKHPRPADQDSNN